MYSSACYPEAPPSPGYHIVGTPATGDDTIPTYKVQRSQDNSARQPFVIRQTVTVVVEAPEIEDVPRDFPVLEQVYRPKVRTLHEPWRAQWRLRQQRPRDGLR